MSASTGVSISGHQTGAPVAFAIGATAPMWSKWVWVSRIPSIVTPSSSAAARIRGGLVAGIDDQRAVGAVLAEQEAVLGDLADREHADVHRLSPPAPARGARLALGALLRLLAEVALVDEPVQREGHRHVEAEHQDPDHQ